MVIAYIPALLGQIFTKRIRTYIFGGFKAVLLSLALLLFAPNTLMTMPAPGLDPSYNIGISLTIEQNLTFGEDIIFTFGPLGYLSSRLPIAVGKTSLLVWDAVIFALIIFALVYIFWHLNSYMGVLLGFAAIFVVSRDSLRIEAYPLLFLFLAYHYLRQRSLVSLLLAAGLNLVLFYIKLSVGMVVLVMMGLLLTYLFAWPTEHSRRVIAAVGVAYLLALISSALALNTNLVGYIWGGLQLISAFNDAMYIYYKQVPIGTITTGMALFILIPFFSVFVVNIKRLWDTKDELVQYILMGLYVFVLFKYGFVRLDQHVLVFFQTISLAIGLLCFFSERPINRQLASVMAIALVMSIPYAARIYTPEQIGQRLASMTITEPVTGSLNHIKYEVRAFRNYLSQAVDPNYPPVWKLPEQQLPSEILDIIGSRSVDIVPWQITTIYANNLNYNPRPVIQSYQAYNSYLDTKNYQKYVSSTAPEFVLYSSDRLDNRHPSFTEAKTRLALLTHYRPVAEFDQSLLLQKREQPLKVAQFPLIEAQTTLDQTIAVEASEDLIYLTADIKYSIWGYLSKLLYQPPPLYVTVTLYNGEERTFQAIITMVEGGVPVNKLVTRTREIRDYFSKLGHGGATVTAIKFHSPESWGFQPDFNYKLQKVVLLQPIGP